MTGSVKYWNMLVAVFLALAGGADMISGVFRGIIWNQTIPDEYRGRASHIWRRGIAVHHCLLGRPAVGVVHILRCPGQQRGTVFTE